MTTSKHLPQQIEGNRITLRRFTMADAEPFYKFLREDDNVRYMFFTDNQRTKDGAIGLVKWVTGTYDTDDPACILVIADKSTGDYVGHIGAATLKDSTDTEIFYTLLPQHRGKGYMNEAVKTFLGYLFEEGIHTAVAIIVPDNTASIKVMERLHAQFAGDFEIHGQPGLRYEITRAIFERWGSG